MLSPFSSPLLLVFLLLPTHLLGRPNGGEILASVNGEGTEDYEVMISTLVNKVKIIVTWWPLREALGSTSFPNWLVSP